MESITNTKKSKEIMIILQAMAKENEQLKQANTYWEGLQHNQKINAKSSNYLLRQRRTQKIYFADSKSSLTWFYFKRVHHISLDQVDSFTREQGRIQYTTTNETTHKVDKVSKEIIITIKSPQLSCFNKDFTNLLLLWEERSFISKCKKRKYILKGASKSIFKASCLKKF